MKNNNKGFTLVELLITVGLITIITIVSSDFLLNLVSSSVRIQNKATLEQNYSFITSKIVKLIQEADSVAITSSSEINITLDGVTQSVKLIGGTLVVNSTDFPLSYSGNLNISSDEAFAFISSSNPQQIKIKLKFNLDSETKLGADQDFERIVTVRKSYKN